MALKLPGLKGLALEACFSNEWTVTRNYLRDNLGKDTLEHYQLMNINPEDNIIFKCCENGYKELISLFLKNGFPVDEFVCKNLFGLYPDDHTMLHLAARGGHINLIKTLISCGASVNICDNHSHTPLFHAVESGSPEVVHYLIKKGANISHQDVLNQTVLYRVLSCHSVNVDILTCLLQAGCDVNVKDKYNLSPLCVCVDYDNLHCVKLLLEFGANPNDIRALYSATLKEKIEILELMLMYGLNVNITDDKTNNTALHYAAKACAMNSIQFFLNHGADVNIKNDLGKTPIFYSFKRFDGPEIFNMFFNYGADINGIDKKENTLLHVAARNGILPTVELLLDKGIDVNAKNIVGDTPLRKCAFKFNFGNRETMIDIKFLNFLREKYMYIIGMLINWGADAYVADSRRRTLLHWAAWYGSVELLKFLVEYGLDVNAVDLNGYKAIDLARMTGHKDIEICIFEYNCSKYSSCKHI